MKYLQKMKTLIQKLQDDFKHEMKNWKQDLDR